MAIEELHAHTLAIGIELDRDEEPYFWRSINFGVGVPSRTSSMSQFGQGIYRIML
jgi:hypothetical protein